MSKKGLRLLEKDKLNRILNKLDSWRYLEAVEERITPEQVEAIKKAQDLLRGVVIG
jgi:predicted Holliday junction resolvase-like endonuclease